MPICPLVGVPSPRAFIVTLPPRVSMMPLYVMVPVDAEGVPSGLTPALNTTLSGPPAPDERIVVPTPLAWMLLPE